MGLILLFAEFCIHMRNVLQYNKIRSRGASEANVVDHTLLAFPYRTLFLASSIPLRCLILDHCHRIAGYQEFNKSTTDMNALCYDQMTETRLLQMNEELAITGNSEQSV